MSTTLSRRVRSRLPFLSGDRSLALLREEMDDLLNPFCSDGETNGSPLSSLTWPSLDISETDGEIPLGSMLPA